MWQMYKCGPLGISIDDSVGKWIIFSTADKVGHILGQVVNICTCTYEPEEYDIIICNSSYIYGNTYRSGSMHSMGSSRFTGRIPLGIYNTLKELVDDLENI